MSKKNNEWDFDMNKRKFVLKKRRLFKNKKLNFSKGFLACDFFLAVFKKI